jgi:hypothetical protein
MLKDEAWAEASGQGKPSMIQIKETERGCRSDIPSSISPLQFMASKEYYGLQKSHSLVSPAKIKGIPKPRTAKV